MSDHGSPDMGDVIGSKRRGRSSKVGRFTPIRWKDYAYEPEAEEHLVDGLVPREGIGVCYGKQKSFKTFVMLDLGVAIARKDLREWAGRATRQGTVVYICCEGARGLRKRIEAYKRRHRALRDLDFYIIPTRPALGLRPGDAKELIAAIRAELGNDQPVLVIIDTLARTLAGQNENGEGMQNFIEGAEDVAEAFKCFVFAVHHEGAGDKDRMRGYTALDGASMATWRVKKTSNGSLGCTVTIQEAKDSSSGETLHVTLERFELGDEHDENRHTTLMVESIEIAVADHSSQPATKKRAGMTPTLTTFMTSFDIALHRHGIEVRLPDNGPKVKAVTLDYLRNTYYGKRSDLDDVQSKGAAFRRHLQTAIDREVLVSGTINGLSMLWRP
jgi:hypothetical protein